MKSYWVLNATSELPARICVSGDMVDASNYFAGKTDIGYPVYIEDGVQNASDMFSGCTTFNCSVSIPVTVSNCDRMFFNCESFNKVIKISNANASCKDMFEGCKTMDSSVYCTESQFNESGLKKLAYQYDATNSVAYFKKQPQKEISRRFLDTIMNTVPIVTTKSSEKTCEFDY